VRLIRMDGRVIEYDDIMIIVRQIDLWMMMGQKTMYAVVGGRTTIYCVHIDWSWAARFTGIYNNIIFQNK